MSPDRPLLLLVHHGHAVGPEVDPMRPLSAAGWAASERLATAAAARGVKPDALWHSGKLRARQTAEIFWRTCNPLATISAERGLRPEDGPRWICDQLLGETRDVIVVGHMPALPRLLASLLGHAATTAWVSFPLNGCVALCPDGDHWKEIWRIEE